MIELNNNTLEFSFPEVHPCAKVRINFQRTLRIPDDGRDYPLPPGLGRFDLRHVDDFANAVPSQWIERGGVMLPMYQSEAMWLHFSGESVADREVREYPFAIKVSAGKINAVTGDPWTNRLGIAPQNYMVTPRQPWLDGYCVGKGVVRQFVAMPLGSGYSAEEQVTGDAQHGGLQIAAYPMKRAVFERRFPKIERREIFPLVGFAKMHMASRSSASMGLAPGGRMKQEIYEDPYGVGDWDTASSSRCFVHIANSLVWRSITGQNPPAPPLTSKEYTKAGLPWFDFYDDSAVAVDGSKTLKNLKSVATLSQEKGDAPLPENDSVQPERVIELRRGLHKNQVREEVF